MKKMGMLATFISVCFLMGYNYYLNYSKTISSRAPSSVMVDKAQLISSIKWHIGENHSKIRIKLSCQDWTSLEVTLKAEGMAYSGEPSRMVQTSLCEDGHDGFYQIWPHDLMQNYSEIQKIGLYDEPPPEWTLEKMKFFGSLGAVEISAVEIYRQIGEIFIFEAYF